jgi:hypothetical protein
MTEHISYVFMANQIQGEGFIVFGLQIILEPFWLAHLAQYKME